MMKTNRQPSIRWSEGTAYDLFASLHVLHHPEKFGLRPSWAAGVRSRLTAAQRTVLEDSQTLFFNPPIGWISELPKPRDAVAVLRALGTKLPGELLPFMAFHADIPSSQVEMLEKIRSTGSWNDDELGKLQSFFHQRENSAATKKLITSLKWWVNSQEFGERYLDALQAYVEVFFAEEEKRISIYLQEALDNAQEQATRMDFSRLMLELSQGVKITVLEEADEVTFAPSYWITPLVMYDTVEIKKWVVLFGARPAEVSLVPGEVIPNAMLRALKALSDPTRLLILHYLSDTPATPSQLARKLRLRAPTVVHHLSTLRLAGLVYISMEAEGEKHYTIRSSVVSDTFTALSMFLSIKHE
jgi:DNA-binding transcriptional ArsR family regulator